MIHYTPNAEWGAQFKELTGFLLRWYGAFPLQEAAIDRAIDPRIPAPLRRLYEVVPRVEGIMAINRLRSPGQLRYLNNGVEFYEEAQRLCWWIADRDGENPQVQLKFADPNIATVTESERLCGFLYQMCVFEAIEGASHGYYSRTYTTRRAIAEVLSHWKISSLSPWHWPNYPTFFLHADRAVAILSEQSGGKIHFQFGAPDADGLDFMKPFLRDQASWNTIR